MHSLHNISLVLLVTLSFKASAFDHAYAKWDRFLKTYVEVVNGSQSRVAYLKAKDNHRALDEFVADVSATTSAEYDSWTEPRREAFLINAFNAFAVKRVLEKNVPASLKGTGGMFISVFDEPFFKLFGADASLNRIEKSLARAKFKTALFAFSLNHAAKGDPMLRAEPWRPETLAAQFDESVRVFLGDPSRNMYDANTNTLEVSKVFDWHKDEIISDPAMGGSVAAFLTKYMSRQGSAIPISATIKYLPFDWTLNQGDAK